MKRVQTAEEREREAKVENLVKFFNVRSWGMWAVTASMGLLLILGG